MVILLTRGFAITDEQKQQLQVSAFWCFIRDLLRNIEDVLYRRLQWSAHKRRKNAGDNR
jgi:hypothetical protein